MSETNDKASTIDGLVIRNVSYEIQDNNNWLQIVIDGRESLCGIDIHYDESRGFFFDDGFLQKQETRFKKTLPSSYSRLFGMRLALREPLGNSVKRSEYFD